MASAGEKVTFHVLFLDALNERVAVEDATIEVFTFDEDGERVDLVDAGTVMSTVEDDVGRYSYTYLIDAGYNLGSRIYALMQGTDPDSGFTVLVEDISDVYELGSGGAGAAAGMTARFIK